MTSSLCIIFLCHSSLTALKALLSQLSNSKSKLPEGLYLLIIIDNPNSSYLSNLNHICTEISKHLPTRIHSNTTNLGPGLSRNLSIDLASSEFITFFDDDDIPSLSGILTTFTYLDVAHQDVIHCLATIDSRRRPNSLSAPLLTYYHTAFSRLSLFLPNIFLTPCWGKVYSRSFLIKNSVLCSSIRLFEDELFSQSIRLTVSSIFWLPISLVTVRSNPDSRTRSMKLQSYLLSFPIMREILHRTIIAKHPLLSIFTITILLPRIFLSHLSAYLNHQPAQKVFQFFQQPFQ